MDIETKDALGRLSSAYWLALGVILTIGLLSIVLSIVVLVNIKTIGSTVYQASQSGVEDYFKNYAPIN